MNTGNFQNGMLPGCPTLNTQYPTSRDVYAYQQNPYTPFAKVHSLHMFSPPLNDNTNIRCPAISPLQQKWPEYHSSLKRAYESQENKRRMNEKQAKKKTQTSDSSEDSSTVPPPLHIPFDLMVKSSFGRIESRDYNNYYKLLVEMPGMKKDDVHIEMEDNFLIVSCYRPDKDIGEDYKILYSERRTGDFERKFEILNDIDKDAISGDFKDGILYITLPKKIVDKKPERKKILLT